MDGSRRHALREQKPSSRALLTVCCCVRPRACSSHPTCASSSAAHTTTLLTVLFHSQMFACEYDGYMNFYPQTELWSVICPAQCLLVIQLRCRVQLFCAIDLGNRRHYTGAEARCRAARGLGGPRGGVVGDWRQSRYHC